MSRRDAVEISPEVAGGVRAVLVAVRRWRAAWGALDEEQADPEAGLAAYRLCGVASRDLAAAWDAYAALVEAVLQSALGRPNP